MLVYTDLFFDVEPLGRILSQLIKEAILDTFYSIFLLFSIFVCRVYHGLQVIHSAPRREPSGSFC